MFDKLESIVGDIGKPGGLLQKGHHLLFSESFKREQTVPRQEPEIDW